MSALVNTWLAPATSIKLSCRLSTQVSRRIIKGRPFKVGFECEAELYRKEHPYEHVGNLVQPSTANRRRPGRSVPPQYFDLLRRSLQELKSVAGDRDAPFVASRERVSDVVCSFGSTLEQAKDG